MLLCDSLHLAVFYNKAFLPLFSANAHASGSRVIDLCEDENFHPKPNKHGKSKASPPDLNLDKHNVFWHRSQDCDPPGNFTPGK